MRSAPLRETGLSNALPPSIERHTETPAGAGADEGVSGRLQATVGSRPRAESGSEPLLCQEAPPSNEQYVVMASVGG
jgi:hypothetical protein